QIEIAARRQPGARTRFVHAVNDERGAASSDASASKRPVQYSFAVRDAFRSRSLVCAIATMLLPFPFAVNPTMTTVPSGHARRIAFDAVALRTTTPLSSSQRRRVVSLAQARNSVLTGTSNVRLFVAS